MEERRRYVRANGLLLVNYKIPQLQLEGKSSAYDVSGSGVRITVDKKLKLGSLVEMEIYLPGNSQPILAKGEIIWTQRCATKAESQITPQKEYLYVGIKFTSIDENNKNKIVNYVHRKLRQAKVKM